MNLNNNSKSLIQANKTQFNHNSIRLVNLIEICKKHFKLLPIGNKNIMMLFSKVLTKKWVREVMLKIQQVIGGKNLIKQNKADNS